MTTTCEAKHPRNNFETLEACQAPAVYQFIGTAGRRHYCAACAPGQRELLRFLMGDKAVQHVRIMPGR